MLQDTISWNRDIWQSQEPSHRNLRPEITLKVETQFFKDFHPCNVAARAQNQMQDVQHPVYTTITMCQVRSGQVSRSGHVSSGLAGLGEVKWGQVRSDRLTDLIEPLSGATIISVW